MKKITFKHVQLITGALLLLLSGNQLFAQSKAVVGFRFMPTISSLKLQTSSGGTVKSQAVLGFGIGGVVGFNFTEHVAVQAEIMYNSLSQKYKTTNEENQINLKYINVPVLLSLNTGRYNPINANVVLGPQVGFSIGSSLSSSGSDTAQAVLAVRKSDFGFAYGAGVDFGLNPKKSFRLAIGFRGVYGLFDIASTNQSTSNNSYYIVDKSNIQTYAAYVGVNFLF